MYIYVLICKYNQLETKRKENVKNQQSHPNLVWYVSYGSNISRERFDYYIQGGKMPVNGHVHLGCRDKTPPRRVKQLLIPHKLYFGATDSDWGGGVAFIDERESSKERTRGYAYLITEEQFADVVAQENLLKRRIPLSVDRIVRQKRYIMNELGAYGEILYLGDIDGVPSVTFTAPRRHHVARPSVSYLRQIAQGLRETYRMNPQEVARYFQRQTGVRGRLTTKELVQLQK